jgi:formyltetrahydrofolate synthetase
MSSLSSLTKDALIRLIGEQVTELNALRAEVSKLRVQRVADSNQRTLTSIKEAMAAARAEAVRTGKCVKIQRN